MFIRFQTRFGAIACVISIFSTAASVETHAQVAGGEFDPADTDVVPRYFHAGGLLQNGVMMVSGGLGLQIIPPSLYSRNHISFYDPLTNTFSASFQPLGGGGSTTPVLALARSSHTQTTLNDGRVLITGGNISASGTNPGTPTNSVEIFDAQTGLVGAGPAMSAARSMHTATLLPDGRVVVTGGSTWQLFNPVANAWSIDLPLQRSRTAHAAVLLQDYAGAPSDDRVLLIGGGGSGSNSMEILNPATSNSTLLTSTLSVGVDDLAAAALDDGRVFICGGQNTSTGDTIADTYLFDPLLDNLTAVADAPNRAGGIADHQIALFGDMVAIFGGEQQTAGVDTILDYVALFDTQNDLWAADGGMLFVHDDFAAVRISDCSVLLVDGGVPLFGQEAPASNCEIFTLQIEGDVDGDGDVDLSDLATLLANYGLSGPGLPGDIDSDGDVDLSDLAALLANYGRSCT